MSLSSYVVSLVLATSATLVACGGDVTGGGTGGCPAVPIHCNYGCRYGVVGSDAPSCHDGQWVCPSPGPMCFDGGDDIAEGGLADGGAHQDAAADAPIDVVVTFDAASIACGPTLMCMNDTTFCEEASGGPPPPPDSGPGVGYSCPTFPAACAANRTCACLRAANVCGGAIVDCRTTGAGITVSCAFP